MRPKIMPEKTVKLGSTVITRLHLFEYQFYCCVEYLNK
jgi:hypothetical protein